MTDTIRGPVTEVIDGDTFDMEVTHVGKANENDYSNSERVRIADIDAPELKTSGGKRSKQLLANKLYGQEVRCFVEARDTYGRVVAEVSVL